MDVRLHLCLCWWIIDGLLVWMWSSIKINHVQAPCELQWLCNVGVHVRIIQRGTLTHHRSLALSFPTTFTVKMQSFSDPFRRLLYLFVVFCIFYLRCTWPVSFWPIKWHIANFGCGYDSLSTTGAEYVTEKRKIRELNFNHWDVGSVIQSTDPEWLHLSHNQPWKDPRGLPALWGAHTFLRGSGLWQIWWFDLSESAAERLRPQVDSVVHFYCSVRGCQSD